MRRTDVGRTLREKIRGACQLGKSIKQKTLADDSAAVAQGLSPNNRQGETKQRMVRLRLIREFGIFVNQIISVRMEILGLYLIIQDQNISCGQQRTISGRQILLI